MVIIKIITTNDMKLDDPVTNTDSFLSIYNTYNYARLESLFYNHYDVCSGISGANSYTPFKKTLITGSLESANSSILLARNFFKDFGGGKNQHFMLIRLNCGGDVHD